MSADMNRTLITLGFFVILGLGVIGLVLLIILKPEAVASFTSSLTTLLGIGTAAVVTIYGLGKHQSTLERVEKQTNGTLSARDAEIRRLTDALITAGINPAGSSVAAADTPSSTAAAEA